MRPVECAGAGTLSSFNDSFECSLDWLHQKHLAAGSAVPPTIN